MGIGRVLTGYRADWRDLAVGLSAGVREEAEWIITDSPFPAPFFNRLQIYATPRDPAAVVALAAETFRARGVGFTLEVFDGADPACDEAALAEGLEQIGQPPIMVHAAPGTVAPGGVPGCEVGPLRPEEVEPWGATMSEGFGMASAATGALTAAVVGHPLARPVAARADGRIVGTALGFVRNGGVGVYSVTTIPDYRRRGIGAAATATVVRAAAGEGADIAFLQSTEMGYGVYEGLGFRTVVRSRIYRGT